MKNATSPLLHALEGRVRLKVPGIKGNSQGARGLESFLSQVHGVENVAANPVTGNVLIFYHSHIITQQQIIRCLVEGGHLSFFQDGSQASGSPEISKEIVARLATAILEAALSRLLLGIN